MPNSKSRQAAANFPAKHPLDSNALIPVISEYVTKAGDVINDIVEMSGLPRDCVPVDVIVDNGPLGAGATLDVGLLSGEYGDAVLGRTMPATDFVAAGAAATAGVIRRNRVATGLVVQTVDRSVGIRFLGANPAPGQTIRMVLLCAPNPGALVAV